MTRIIHSWVCAMSSPDINALLERVKAAVGPDRRIDGDIAEALEQVPDWCVKRSFRQPELWTDSRPGLHARTWMADKYTASIDAALALVERVLPGWMVVNLCEWDADVLRARGPWNCALKAIGTQDDFSAAKGACHHAPTAPLAILAATLSALSNRGEHHD